MNERVDARGLSCPKPVIETKKILDALTEGSVTTIVDNEAAMQNVKKLAESMSYCVNVQEIEGDYYIHMYKGELSQDVRMQSSKKKDLVILFGTNTMGQGSAELGKVLLRSYIYALAEYQPYPKALLFVNDGVRLTTEGSDVIEYLRKLESEGVEILSCGTCLDYYHLKDKLMVGGVTNMYTIVEKLHGFREKIIW